MILYVIALESVLKLKTQNIDECYAIYNEFPKLFFCIIAFIDDVMMCIPL